MGSIIRLDEKRKSRKLNQLQSYVLFNDDYLKLDINPDIKMALELIALDERTSVDTLIGRINFRKQPGVSLSIACTVFVSSYLLLSEEKLLQS